MTEAGGPAATVQNYIDAFNRGDAQAMASCFASDGAILDGMAPYVWVGPSATSDWWRDVLVEGSHLGALGYHATIGEPVHNNITGDSAYIFASAAMGFNLNGREVKQTGATFTFALRKEGADWKIAAWAWAKGRAA